MVFFSFPMHSCFLMLFLGVVVVVVIIDDDNDDDDDEFGHI